MKLPGKKLTAITIVYWVLLLYIIAALVWWFIALEQQNQLMTTTEVLQLNKEDPAYEKKYYEIIKAKKRKSTQYIGEGVTFLILISLGAFFVYRAMHRRLSLSRQQQNFMMAVTHELKTPIAVAKLNLETMQKRALNVQQQQKLIQNTLQETYRLNELCNNILFAAQIDRLKKFEQIKEINLSQLLQETVNAYTERFPAREISLNTYNNIFIAGDEFSIELLINNLINNALKYSPKESAVVISTEKKDNKIILNVADEGEGVAPGEKKKIFEKFYRVGNENTRKTKGTGLGLYISKKIAEKHNATLEVENNKPAGSIFRLSFTLAK